MDKYFFKWINAPNLSRHKPTTFEPFETMDAPIFTNNGFLISLILIIIPLLVYIKDEGLMDKLVSASAKNKFNERHQKLTLRLLRPFTTKKDKNSGQSNVS